MKVFIDTNVILENFLRREDYDVAHRLFEVLQDQGHTLYISSGSFYSMVFLVDKYLKKELGIYGDDRIVAVRQMMSSILKVVCVAGHDNASLLQGINDKRFSDLEDSCQHQAAVKAGCDCLISFNLKDYANGASVKAMTPAEFLGSLSEKK